MLIHPIVLNSIAGIHVEILESLPKVNADGALCVLGRRLALEVLFVTLSLN